MARLVWWRQGGRVSADAGGDVERLPAIPVVERGGRRWFNPRRSREERERFAAAERLEAERQAERDAGVEAGLQERAEWLQRWREEGAEPMPPSAGAPLRRAPRPGPGRWGSVQAANLDGSPPGRWTDIAATNLDRPPRRRGG